MSSLANIYQSKWVTLLAAGGVAFVCYACYFDRKRRFDPNYKQKIRQNRKAKQARASKTSNSVDFPDPHDVQDSAINGVLGQPNHHKPVQSCEAFFFQQISIGEEHLQSGDIVTGVFHLSNAVTACSQPSELLNVLQQTIPPAHFKMLVQALPEARQRQQASLQNITVLQRGPQIEEMTGQDDADNENPKKVFMIDDELE